MVSSGHCVDIGTVLVELMIGSLLSDDFLLHLCSISRTAKGIGKFRHGDGELGKMKRGIKSASDSKSARTRLKEYTTDGLQQMLITF